MILLLISLLDILASWLTLKVVTFSIHEDVVDQNDTEDAGPEMNVTEHKHKPNILEKKTTIQNKSWFIITALCKQMCEPSTYIEGIEEYEQWNLYHADLHSNATAHFKAADRKMTSSNFMALYTGSIWFINVC